MKTLLKATSSEEETYLLGKTVAKQLSAGAILAFYGDLGAGKTTFIRGIVDGIGGADPRVVCSPTFTFLNIYPTSLPTYHFDLYRLPQAAEFFKAGFDEYLHAGGICCIEWAEKIQEYLPPETRNIHFAYKGETAREITLS